MLRVDCVVLFHYALLKRGARITLPNDSEQILTTGAQNPHAADKGFSVCSVQPGNHSRQSKNQQSNQP